MFKQFFIFLIVVLSVTPAGAQNFKPEAYQTCDWKLLEVATGASMALSYEYAYAFEKSILYIADDEAVVSVWHSALGHALIRIGQDTKVKWKSAVPGYIIGTSKFKDKVIAFYTKEWNYKEYGYSALKEVSAIVYDIETGKKVTDKVVYVNESKKFVEPGIHSQSDGQFAQLLIRQTNYSGKGIQEKRASTGITVIGLNDRLEASFTHSLSSEALKGEYLGSLINDKGETFVATYSENKVVVEKFDKNHAAAGRLESPGSYENKGVILRINNKNDQSLLAAMTERKQRRIELAIYEFDFITSKVNKSEQTIDKESVKTWRGQNKEQEQRLAEFKDIDNLTLAGIVQTDDKIITLMQERYTRFDNNGRISGTTIGPAVILFYDRKLKLLNSQTLAKEFDIDNRYLMEWTIGSHIYDGKLLLVTNDGVKSRTISPVINTIDLATMKAEPAFYVEKEGRGTEGAATLWFKKNFIITSGRGPIFRRISF